MVRAFLGGDSILLIPSCNAGMVRRVGGEFVAMTVLKGSGSTGDVCVIWRLDGEPCSNRAFYANPLDNVSDLTRRRLSMLTVVPRYVWE